MKRKSSLGLKSSDFVYTKGKLSMSPKAFYAILETTGSKAKSESGQRRAVRRWLHLQLERFIQENQ